MDGASEDGTACMHACIIVCLFFSSCIRTVLILMHGLRYIIASGVVVPLCLVDDTEQQHQWIYYTPMDLSITTVLKPHA